MCTHPSGTWLQFYFDMAASSEYIWSGWTGHPSPSTSVFPFFPLFILFISNLWGTTYLFPVLELLNTTHYHYLSYGHDFSYTLKQLIYIYRVFYFSLSEIDVDFDLEISRKKKKKKNHGSQDRSGQL